MICISFKHADPQSAQNLYDSMINCFGANLEENDVMIDEPEEINGTYETCVFLGLSTGPKDYRIEVDGNKMRAKLVDYKEDNL